MSRDLFVGPLCRYFAADAAEAAQRKDGVVAWLADVAASLEGRLKGELPWEEDPSDEPEVFDLGPRGLDAVRLLAVYADRSELDLPDAMPDPLALDPHWAAAEREDFGRSRYGHLVAASFWLPADFDFTFRGPRPDGADATFGSLFALRDQVGFVNARTFAASDATLEEWRRIEGDRFVDAARRGVAGLTSAIRRAVDRHVPLAVLA